MTSPYSVAPATAPIQERRPSYDDLKLRAEEGGYLGGRGKMDTLEWYQLCYFTPIEIYLYQTLRSRFQQEMTGDDAGACVSVWIYAHSVSTPTYERIADRMLWFAEEEETPAAVLRQAWERGFIFYNIDTDDPTAKTIEADQVVITLRQDIEDFLSWLVNKECVENDADIIATHGKEAFDELTAILRKSQERDFPDDRCNT